MKLKVLTLSILVIVLAACEKEQKLNGRGEREIKGTSTELLPAYCPVPIDTKPPVYPEILQRAGFEAVVELSALVDEHGNVIDVEIVKSSPMVDSVCIVAAKQWKFKPGRIADSTGNYDVAKFWFPVRFNWGTRE